MRSRRLFLAVREARAVRAVSAVGLLVALSTGLAAAPAAAELETVSQVGAVAVAEGQATTGMRRRALADAVGRAVNGVARRLVEADGAPTPARPDLDRWLGDDRRDYTSSFRVVRDLGVRAPQLLDPTATPAEYAVAAEVIVDAGLVRRRLLEAGVVRPQASQRPPSGRLLLVLEPLDSHAAYAYVRETLGAVPVEFSRGRAVLGLETDLHPDGVVERLRREAPPDIRIGRSDWDGSTLRLEVRQVPPEDDSGAAARLTP
jgi:hypothetical protein